MERRRNRMPATNPAGIQAAKAAGKSIGAPESES
jgi:hypothetical protein